MLKLEREPSSIELKLRVAVRSSRIDTAGGGGADGLENGQKSMQLPTFGHDYAAVQLHCGPADDHSQQEQAAGAKTVIII